MGTIIALIMAGLIAGMGLIPLRQAAEYRFRNQLGKTIKGLAYIGVALLGFLTAGIAGWLILSGGLFVGAGLLATSRDSNNNLLR